MLVSSAKSMKSKAFDTLHKSLMYNKNNNFTNQFSIVICSLDNMGVCVTTDRDCNHGSRLSSHSCLLLRHGQETLEVSQSL